MIVVRTPLRIPLGGGGTDLPSYYSQFGGSFITATLQQFVTVALHPTFGDEFIIKYSKTERTREPHQIENPIIREVFKKYEITQPLELVSFADIPSGTGLGSSGAFTVSLIRAIHALQKLPIDPHTLAEQASSIEIDQLSDPVGKQDPFACSFGGFRSFEISRTGEVTSAPLDIKNETIVQLEKNLVMVYTGLNRLAPQVLLDQKTRSLSSDPGILENLHQIRQIGVSIKQSLERGDLTQFARLMDEHWRIKRHRSPQITNPEIDRLYQLGIRSGALGGKLMGAGGGGFLLFYAPEKDRLRQIFMRENVRVIPVKFCNHGAKVWTLT